MRHLVLVACLASLASLACGASAVSPEETSASGLAAVHVDAGPAPLWHGDETFSAAERAEIERGEAWLSAHVGRAPGRIAWDLPHPPAGAPRPRLAFVRRHGPSGPEYTGETYPDTSTIYLDPDGAPGSGMRIEYLAGLTAHELGHWHGLSDDRDSNGVMHRLAGPRWTDREQAQCVRLGLCM